MTTEQKIENLKAHRDALGEDIGALTILNLEDDEYYIKKAVEDLILAYKRIGVRVKDLENSLKPQAPATIEGKAITVIPKCPIPFDQPSFENEVPF